MVNRKVMDRMRGQLVKTMDDLQCAVSRKDVRMKTTSDNLPDFLDQAATEHDRALELTIRGRESRKIREILEAIQRIDRGQYGICDRCGKTILQQRLLLAPMSCLCTACKEMSELHQNHRSRYSHDYDTGCENHDA